MSLYNTMHGVSPLTFLALPLLGDKHADKWPRFRDVFVGDEEHPEYDQGRGDQFYIHVYTRMGGNNRSLEEYTDEMKEMLAHPNYVTSWDDSFDSTYATYLFTVPEKWVADWQKILVKDFKNLSPECKAQCVKVFPKMEGRWPW